MMYISSLSAILCHLRVLSGKDDVHYFVRNLFSTSTIWQLKYVDKMANTFVSIST